MKQNKLFKMLSMVGVSILSMGMLAGCGASASTAATASAASTGTATPAATAAATTTPAAGAADGTIVMGTNAEFEPFEYRDGMDVVGFDVDISNAIAKKLGKKLQIEDVAFDSLIMGLNQGKMNFVAAGMTATDERKTQVDFSDPYFTSHQVIIVKADNNDIKTADDLKGKKVGVQTGTTGDLDASATDGIGEVDRFDKGTLAIMDLKNNKVDAVVIDAEPAKKMTDGQSDLKILDAPFADEQYAIAVKKGDTELLNTINATIKELKDSGEYDKMYAKYFGEVK